MDAAGAHFPLTHWPPRQASLRVQAVPSGKLAVHFFVVESQ